MTTVNDIQDRLNAVAFAGRSYAGLDPRVAAKEYAQAVEVFEQNAAVDMAYLLDRVDELQKAIIIAAAALADAAVTIADRYAGNDAEAREIRLAVDEPIDALVNVSQGTREVQEDDE